MVLPDFEAEQWMTDYEQQAVHNLTDSSISALTFEELMALEPALLKDLRLDYGEITGDHRLKREILSFYRDQNEETLTFANGCLHANKVAMEVLLNEGDHVITIVPGYQQYTEVPLSMGCTVTEIPLEMDTWRVDLDQVRQAIQENTKLIILNNPGNPTGYHLDAAQLQELAEIAREHDLWILSDEVYMLPDEEHPSIADVYEKGVAPGSLSKTLGLPGLRLGWIKAPQQIIHDINVGRDYSFISTGPLRDVLGYIALLHKEELMDRAQQIVSANKNTIQSWLDATDLFSCTIPKTGTVGFLKLEGLTDSKAFARKLLEETGIFLVPGACFGCEGYFRLGFGQQQQDLSGALEQLEHFASRWMENPAE